MNRLQGRACLVALALALTLSGCGGSGGGSGGVDLKASPATTPTAVSTSFDSGAEPSSSTAAGMASTSTTATATPFQPLANGPIESKVSVGSEGREVDPFKPRDARAAPIPVRIALPGLSVEDSRLQKTASGIFGAPQKVGVARPALETATAAQTSASLAWTTSQRGGHVAAIRFDSAGALGVRLGLVVRALPFGTFLRFYADGADTLYEIPGQEVLAGISRNLAAGDSSDAARTYWSPNLRGAAVTMEIEIPASARASEVDVAIPSLSHLLVDTHKAGSIGRIGQAGSCNLDVACTSTYNALSQSVALMEFMSGGSAYVCTGTLLNDRMSTGTPYFLTAKHCIPNQTVASTLETTWFFRSSSCGSGAVSPGVRTLTQGATMLYASPDAVGTGPVPGDTSFLRLNEAPPAGALYAGSSPIALEANAPVYGVHHPSGDVQKYSVGTFTGTSQCTSSGCLTPGSTSPNFMRVNWTQGVTEGGSSGSGVFTRLNGKDYLVGQLLGGGSSCRTPSFPDSESQPDFYGRFDVAYSAALSQWLNATNTTTRIPVYRFYNTRTDTHFYTSTQVERDYVLTQHREYNYESIAFWAYAAAPAGSSPVYRFFNTRAGAHFYTIAEQERQSIQANIPWYSFEGISWYASQNVVAGTVPIYRFHRPDNGTHFYTTDSYERDYILQNRPQYVYENVVYYAWASQ